jgi:hypothetical protein
MMTAWEYAYLHSVSIQDSNARISKEERVYIIQESTGAHILSDVHYNLNAFNKTGSEGWIVQMPELQASGPSPVWIQQMVNPTLPENLTVGYTLSYALRRAYDL